MKPNFEFGVGCGGWMSSTLLWSTSRSYMSNTTPFISKGSLVVSTHICRKCQGRLGPCSEIIVGCHEPTFVFDPRCLGGSEDMSMSLGLYLWIWRAMFRPSKYFYMLPPKIRFFWDVGEKQIFGTCYPKPKPNVVMDWNLYIGWVTYEFLDG